MRLKSRKEINGYYRYLVEINSVYPNIYNINQYPHMPKVTVVQVIYNSKRFIEPVFEAIFKQNYKDFNVVAVISGNEDGSKQLLMQKFPQVEIIDPGFNIGFAKGHNLVFDKYDSEFFQLVNPDLIMEPDYVEKMVKAFEDPKVAAATGKLYQVDRDAIATRGILLQQKDSPSVLDTTGVTIYNSGRARDRGQHELDNGQYDQLINVQAVSAAGAMYRKKALDEVKYRNEYFDEDFHSYWEDVDLAWRMANAGWKNVFVPLAIGYHGRGAGSSKNGYADVVGFIAHHRKLSPYVRQLNYKNHIFLYIKNSPHFYPQFFVREFFMFFYVLFFEISTLKVLPEFFKLLPKMWHKREYIKKQTPPEALAKVSR
jgi:GT2 family glycosyltransferase